MDCGVDGTGFFAGTPALASGFLDWAPAGKPARAVAVRHTHMTATVVMTRLMNRPMFGSAPLLGLARTNDKKAIAMPTRTAANSHTSVSMPQLHVRSLRTT